LSKPETTAAQPPAPSKPSDPKALHTVTNPLYQLARNLKGEGDNDAIKSSARPQSPVPYKLKEPGQVEDDEEAADSKPRSVTIGAITDTSNKPTTTDKQKQISRSKSVTTILYPRSNKLNQMNEEKEEKEKEKETKKEPELPNTFTSQANFRKSIDADFNITENLLAELNDIDSSSGVVTVSPAEEDNLNKELEEKEPEESSGEKKKETLMKRMIATGFFD